MVEENKIMTMSGSKRRSHLGIAVSKCGDSNLGTIDVIGPEKKDSEFIGKNRISPVNLWKLLRRSKQLLAMRVPTAELIQKLDYRKEWNLGREIESILDLFPSVKFSHSSLRGKKFTGKVRILSNGSKARIDDIARSHSIRLDPVEAPKELFKYRQRIQKIIEWSYANELVPVMMTLTLYHRWDYLDSLCNVLRSAWSELFRGSQGMKRKQYMGLRGYIRRMEETFNDGEDESETNAGWHPHYHVILLIPREKLKLVSEYEDTLKTVWVELVRKHYKAEFGEEIPSSYYETFRQHGLVFSRYKTDEHAARCGNACGKAGDLLEVHDGKYLAKIIGTDDALYGGDTELTAVMQKNSKAPFDMLCGEVTANLADLWCEYALATKKIPCFTFSHGLQKEVDTYFASVNQQSLVAGDSLPEEKLVGCISPENYQWLYRHFQIGDLLLKANEGYEVVKTWLKENFNMEVAETDVNDVLLNAEVVDLSAGLPVSVIDSELVTETVSINLGKAGACSEVLNFSKAGACGSPHQKRAKKFLIAVVGNNQNKSPPYVVGRNKAPPKIFLNIFNSERSGINGRKGIDSS